MKSDIEIARAAKMKPIREIAESVGLDSDGIELFGNYKAKLPSGLVDSATGGSKDGKLILVTAISPTPAGEGKTTTSVGLCDGLRRSGRNAIVALREPSLGPVFGIKGGAAGGGHAQVVPMEDINLHFTGDFAAIGLAHNLLSALVDNHIHHGNQLGIDARRISWKRVVDMNDRALRQITAGLGGPANGYPRQDGFDIVVASEVMAILCLSESLEDLKARLAKIVVARTRTGDPITAEDLGAVGAMAMLLKDAVKPNLVQTLENSPAILHGGPFANIAHGCNSVVATRTALKLADYVVTEAGFGADLGAEKFVDIKCRKSGLRPSAVVLVATVRALKYHGGADLGELGKENATVLDAGLANLERHLRNIREHYGLPAVVALNHFAQDTDAEVQAVKDRAEALGATAVLCTHWRDGGEGAVELAEAVAKKAEEGAEMTFVYEDGETLRGKVEAVASKIYGAGSVVATPAAEKAFAELQEFDSTLPVCLAKTQYSFTAEPSRRGLPQDGHDLTVSELRLCGGAGFVVAICGSMMTMPGLPSKPAALNMDITADGVVSGLF